MDPRLKTTYIPNGANMSKLSLSVLSLLGSLSTHTFPSVAYAEQSTQTIQSDCAGAGCMGHDSSIERSTGLSSPTCVGAACMGDER